MGVQCGRQLASKWVAGTLLLPHETRIAYEHMRQAQHTFFLLLSTSLLAPLWPAQSQ